MSLLCENLPTLDEIKVEKARRHLVDFTSYTFPAYEVNWHHLVVGYYLDQLVAGKIKRLMIFEPPRHGKSEQVSRRLPAFILGKHPDDGIIATSYGADLASRMNRDAQRIIDTDAYKRVFPETKLFGSNVRTVAQGSYLRNSDIFEVVGHRGFYRSAGVGGGITGMGCQWGIIDDPTKNRIEAESPTYRERLWEWYTSTFYTRLEKDAAVLITLTRWHEDDLAGRLLKQQETDPNADKWVVVQFPAIAEEKRFNDDKRKFGEALWPNKYDLTALSKIKTAVGTYDWNALYQQQPSNRSGGIIKRYWWRFWQREGQNLPPVSVRKENGEIVECPVVTLPDEFDEQLLSWDMTFKDTKGTDYVVGQPWGRKGADKFLLDQVRARLDFPATIIAVKDMTNRWPGATAKLVEDKANGSAVISTLKHEITGLIPVEPQGSKEARASAASPQIEAGNVYLPHPFNASWVDDFLTELSAFPNAAHDDQVDATSQALNRFSGGFNAWLDFLIDESDRLKRSKDNNQQQLDNIRRLT